MTRRRRTSSQQLVDAEKRTEAVHQEMIRTTEKIRDATAALENPAIPDPRMPDDFAEIPSTVEHVLALQDQLNKDDPRRVRVLESAELPGSLDVYLVTHAHRWGVATGVSLPERRLCDMIEHGEPLAPGVEIMWSAREYDARQHFVLLVDGARDALLEPTKPGGPP